jgi:hypothetical protein
MRPAPNCCWPAPVMGDEGWRIRLRMLDLLHETVERGQRAGLMLPARLGVCPGRPAPGEEDISLGKLGERRIAG